MLTTLFTGLRLRHIRHFDMRFEKKIADIRRAFVSTSVENVSGLEASATDMQSFLQDSTKRIAVLKERAQSLAAERPLHHIAIELLVNLPSGCMPPPFFEHKCHLFSTG